MRRLGTFAVGILLLVALGVGARFVLSGGPEQVRQENEPQNEANSQPMSSVAQSVPESRVNASAGHTLRADEHIPRGASRAEDPGTGAQELAPDQAFGDIASTSETFEEEEPNAVVGRPFPISESVVSSCLDDGVSCNHVKALIDQFVEQPRDLFWAPEMEAGLREVFSQSSDITIRAIECRTSLCAAEVASPQRPYSGIPATVPLYEKLFNGPGVYAYESDPSSFRVTVMLITFKRRY